ncbi:MAG: copper chaperone PCu(A)C [Sulfuricella sp.]
MKSSSALISLAALLFFCSNIYAAVTASGAWVRGIVKGQTVTGTFMTLKSDEDTKLVSATSPVAGKVEIHKMEMKNDLMTMRPIDKLAIPAGTPVELKPGGYHVMLVDLKHTLVKGEKVPLTLVFESRGGARNTLAVTAEVRDLTAH